jgi:hypothetical protein
VCVHVTVCKCINVCVRVCAMCEFIIPTPLIFTHTLTGQYKHVHEHQSDSAQADLDSYFVIKEDDFLSAVAQFAECVQVCMCVCVYVCVSRVCVRECVYNCRSVCYTYKY